MLNQAVLLKGINDSRVKMWKLCETIQEVLCEALLCVQLLLPQSPVHPLPGSASKSAAISSKHVRQYLGRCHPRYIATAGGKIPLHRTNVVKLENGIYTLRKPWNDKEVSYPDADPALYDNDYVLL